MQRNKKIYFLAYQVDCWVDYLALGYADSAKFSSSNLKLKEIKEIYLTENQRKAYLCPNVPLDIRQKGY